ETVEMRCAIMTSPYSSSSESGSVAEVSVRYRIGWSAGLTFWKDGGAGMFGGSWRAAAAIADWTSRAAPSRFLDRLNWSVICVDPCVEVEFMLSRPAIVVNCFSRGVATEDATVSGEAPGSAAETWIVGKSTLGRSEIGSSRYPMMPKARMPSMTRVVMTGRRMKISAIFMTPSRRGSRGLPLGLLDLDARAGRQAQLPVGDDALSRGKAAADDRERAVQARNRHLARFDGHVALDHVDVLAGLAVLDRLRRDDDGVGLGRERQDDVHVLARPERMVLVGERRLQEDRPGRRVHPV